jgi:hypothetical protein
MQSTELRQEGRWQKGQTLVEFSLVIGFLLLLLFGIIDFSRLFFAYATMSNGVREGARYGIVNPGADGAIIQAAQDMMIIIGGDAAVTVDYPDEVPDPNNPNQTTPFCSHLCRIVVEARSDFDVWTPIIPSFEIVTMATMHIE